MISVDSSNKLVRLIAEEIRLGADSILTYGPSGAGKSHCLRSIEEELSPPSFKVKHINCKGLLQAERGLVEQLFYTLYEKCAEVCASHTSVLLALDDVDAIAEGPDSFTSVTDYSVCGAFLSLLSRAGEWNRATKAAINGGREGSTASGDGPGLMHILLTSALPPTRLHPRIQQRLRMNGARHHSFYLSPPESAETRRSIVLLALAEAAAGGVALAVNAAELAGLGVTTSTGTDTVGDAAVTSIVQSLAGTVAGRSQGLCTGEIANLVRDAALFHGVPLARTDGLVQQHDVVLPAVTVLHCVRSLLAGKMHCDIPCDGASSPSSSASSPPQSLLLLPVEAIRRRAGLICSRPIVNATLVGDEGVGDEGGGDSSEGNAGSADAASYIHFVDIEGMHASSKAATTGAGGGASTAELAEGALLVGQEPVQERLRSVLLAPYKPETAALYRQFNVRPCRGVIIEGPTGCGKTALAHWCIYKGREHFKCISVSCAELVNKVVGESERKLSCIFRVARAYAPCFLLLEGIESILGRSSAEADDAESDGDGDGDGDSDGELEGGRDEDRGELRKAPVRRPHSSKSAAKQARSPPSKKQSKPTRADGQSPAIRARTRTAHHALDRILSTLLVELDGAKSSTAGNAGSTGDDRAVIVIATADNLSSLDKALLRPGRLEEHISLALPTYEQRKTICYNRLQALLRHVENSRRAELLSSDPCPKSLEAVPEVRLIPSVESVCSDIAANTEGKSPADLLKIVVEGWISVMRSRIAALHTQKVGNVSEEEEGLRSVCIDSAVFSKVF